MAHRRPPLAHTYLQHDGLARRDHFEAKGHRQLPRLPHGDGGERQRDRGGDAEGLVQGRRVGLVRHGARGGCD
eukprot:2416555-Prymnesium_polylepis.1